MSQNHSRSSKSKIDPSQDPRGAFLNIDDYIAIKAACLNSLDKDSYHHVPTDLELKECAKYLSQWPGERVIDLWKFGEPKGRPQAVLEIAIRYLSGCTIFRVNPEAALYALDTFHHSDTRDYVGALATPSDLARAHACAAHAHYQKFRASEKEKVSYAADERHYRRRQTLEAGLGHPAHASLRFAMREASESARLGHVSAIVLRVGFTAREIGEGLGVDFGQVVRRAKKYRPLWCAVEDRLNELYAEARKVLEVVRQDPIEYVCGAEGCGTRSKSSASLKACSGKCPPDLKPRYCSKQCQVKDWSRHKEICKPGNVGKIPKIPNRLIALEWFELEDPEPEPTPRLPSPAPEAEPCPSAESLLHDAPPRDEISERATDTVLGHDMHEGAADCAAQDDDDEEENTRHVRAHVQCSVKEAHEAEGNLPSQYSDQRLLVPSDCAVSPVCTSECNFDLCPDEGELRKQCDTTRECPEERVEHVAPEVGDDTGRAVVDECASNTVEDLQEWQGMDDRVSSPGSDHAPLSTPPVIPAPPRPIVFGSISPEYLRTMWEEEGPGALTNTGVWAAKVPTTFVAPC